MLMLENACGMCVQKYCDLPGLGLEYICNKCETPRRSRAHDNVSKTCSKFGTSGLSLPAVYLGHQE